MNFQVTKIPGYKNSRNCLSVASIVRSIYRSFPELTGIFPGIAPSWLKEGRLPDQVDPEQNRKARNNKKRPQNDRKPLRIHKTMQTNTEKGGYPPETLLRKVSADQCFVFRKNFYSLPVSWLGKTVLVSHWQNKLRVYDPKTRNAVCTHSLIYRGKGQYSVLPGHIDHLNHTLTPYLKSLVTNIRILTPERSEQARACLHQYGLFSLRKLWAMRYSHPSGESQKNPSLQEHTHQGQGSSKSC